MQVVPEQGVHSTPGNESLLTVAALYQFAPFDNPESLQAPLIQLSKQHKIKGSLLLAREGINGTIAGSEMGVHAVLKHIKSLNGCSGLEVKFSTAKEMPFWRMKVKLKKEIVTMGVEGIDPSRDVGRYVQPEEWNQLLNDSNVVLIDTRNDYEVGIGTFRNAVNPDTKSFRDFPKWFSEFKKTIPKEATVAMFCTGGIRCEKATAYVKSQGLENVVHLKGGILKYLETVSPNESLWNGECFVFDQRVSVGQGLSAGTHGQCHACRKPLSVEQQASPDFILGVQCVHCVNERDEEQRQRYAERQRQVELAEKRGQGHLGDESQIGDEYENKQPHPE
jgi:UPF0176 protein